MRARQLAVLGEFTPVTHIDRTNQDLTEPAPLIVGQCDLPEPTRDQFLRVPRPETPWVNLKEMHGGFDCSAGASLQLRDHRPELRRIHGVTGSPRFLGS